MTYPTTSQHEGIGARFVLCLLIAIAMPSATLAQDPLLEGEPFDQIILNAANNSAVLEVLPLDFPGRQMPETRPVGRLEVRLVSRPNQAYNLNWSDIAQIRLFEQMLSEKATEFTSAGNFDEAFGYYARLSVEYPDSEGLGPQLDQYLQRNALKLFKEANHDRALAVLGSLHARSPDFPGLSSALNAVASSMIKLRLKEQDYAGARAVLDSLSSHFGRAGATTTQAWQSRFRQAAERKLGEATTLLGQEKYTEAQSATRKAAAIWPLLSGTKELLARIQQLHPQVVIGVFEQAPQDANWRFDNWASLRTARLGSHAICELEDYGEEGGVYRSRFGSFSTDVTDRQLSFQLAEGMGPLAATTLARFLLAMADPTSAVYQSSFDALCDAVAVVGPAEVRIDLSRPHVRPEALLQLANSYDVWGDDVWGDGIWKNNARFGQLYHQVERTNELVRFETDASENPPTHQGLKTIVEQHFDNDEQAAAALLRGDVTVLDRVPPWLVARLQSAEGVRVESYALPTLHVLVPNTKKPILQQREFRRALCYGIARAHILKQLITAGEEVPGFQVISGPLPPGRTLGDPLRYGYNNQIKPRSYEPRLAATLALVAATNVAKQQKAAVAKQQKAAGKPPVGAVAIPPLVLAHPTDPLATAACDLIAQQLRKIGIPIELKPLDADALLAADGAFDLRYAELAVWEPLVDVQVMFGEGSPFGRASPTMQAALRDLEQATNWPTIRQLLNRLHEIAHNDLPVIPLWQTVNHFAYRDELRGIGKSPVSLYQHLNQWEPELAL